MSLVREEEFIAEMIKKKVCKAVWGDYVLYNRKYLAENLDQEYKLTKDWYDYRNKVESGEYPNPKKMIEDLKRRLEKGKDDE